MGLSFLQTVAQVCAAKTIRVRTKRNKEISVRVVKDRAWPL